jgi:hypothetical protein
MNKIEIVTSVGFSLHTWFYRWSVVVAVLLVVVGPASPTTTNSTAITTFLR